MLPFTDMICCEPHLKILGRGGNLITERVVKNFNSLPREVVELPSLGYSKPNLAVRGPEQPAPVNSAF